MQRFKFKVTIEGATYEWIYEYELPDNAKDKSLEKEESRIPVHKPGLPKEMPGIMPIILPYYDYIVPYFEWLKEQKNI